MKSWNWSEQARYEGLLTVLVERQMMHQQNELVAEVLIIKLIKLIIKNYVVCTKYFLFISGKKNHA